MKEIRGCFETPLPIFSTQRMQKTEEHVHHLKVDIHKDCHGSIQC